MVKSNDESISDEMILKAKVTSELKRESYDEGEVNGTVEDYSEMMIQFGYISLWSIGFPILIAITFCNNIVEMFIDWEKVLSLTRRPFPQSAKDNGIFTIIFTLLSFISVFSNIGIMSFTGSTFGENNQYSSFLWFTIIALFIKFFISEVIPDISENSLNIQERHKFVIRKTLVSKGSTEQYGKMKIERINLDVEFTTQKADGFVIPNGIDIRLWSKVEKKRRGEEKMSIDVAPVPSPEIKK